MLHLRSEAWMWASVPLQRDTDVANVETCSRVKYMYNHMHNPKMLLLNLVQIQQFLTNNKCFTFPPRNTIPYRNIALQHIKIADRKLEMNQVDYRKVMLWMWFSTRWSSNSHNRRRASVAAGLNINQVLLSYEGWIVVKDHMYESSPISYVH